MAIQWELLFFSLFVGLGMGAFGFVAITELTGKLEKVRLPGAITALVAIFVGGMFSFFHLGHPERIFHILGNTGSGIAQELIVTSIAGALIVAYILLLLWKNATSGMKKIVSEAGLIFAVIVPLSTGRIYVLPARPAWDTWLIPLLFVASAAALGLLTMYIWTLVKEKDSPHLAKIKKYTLSSQLFFALSVVAYVIYMAAAPHPHATRDISRVLAGDLALLFWLMVVIVGLLVPLFLTYRSLNNSKASGNLSLGNQQMAATLDGHSNLVIPLVGLVCTLIGATGIRIIMYLMGSSAHQFISW